MAPDEKTTALYSRLRATLAHGDRGSPDNADDLPEPKIVGALPHALTSLIGREDERIEIAQLIRQKRLVSLVGPGGIGKTRLASEVANNLAKEFPDGAWIVSFEHVENGCHVLDHLLSVIDVTGSACLPSVQRLLDLTKSKKMLLVLDNCEHLRDDVATIVSKILAESTPIKILATSREALGILGEQVWMVPSLSIPEAHHLPPSPAVLTKILKGYESVQLFIDRARLFKPGYELTKENADSLAHICMQLEGVPLALELAAARVRSMTTKQIAERLSDQLSLLTSVSGGNKRQRTLRATLEWSHGLLAEPERKLFRHLSVFSGGWTLEAAEYVCKEDFEKIQVVDLLSNLVAKSLVLFDEGAGRFRFLETVRQFARERLADAGEIEALRARHRGWCAHLAALAEPKLVGSEVEAWLLKLDAESANFRSAIDEGRGSTEVVQLVGTLWRWWYLRGRYSEGQNFIERVLERQTGANPAALQKAFYGGGCLAYSQGAYETAVRWLEESLALAATERLDEGFAKTLNVLGNVAVAQRRCGEAVSYYERSLSLQQKLGMDAGVRLLHYNLGSLSLSLCDFQDARRRFGEALEFYRRADDPWGSSMCLAGMGLIAAYQGSLDQAEAWIEEAIEKYRSMKDQGRTGTSLYLRSWIALEKENFTLAQDLAERSIACLKSVASFVDETYSAGLLGSVAYARGDYDVAWSILSEAHGLAVEHRVEQVEFILLAYLGATAFRRGEFVQAKRLWADSLRGHLDRKYRYGAAISFDGMAVACCWEGEYERAALCLGSAQALRKEMGVVALRRFESFNEEVERRCGDALGDRVFASICERAHTKYWTEIAKDILEATVEASPSEFYSLA